MNFPDNADDSRLDDFRDLKSADGSAQARGVVIGEGVHVVERMLNSPYAVRAVFGVPSRLAELAPTLADHPDVAVYSGDKWLLSEVAGFRVTRGVLASASRTAHWNVSDLLRESSRIVLLEGLNDFENLGALFRNVAAFGADAVLLDAQCANPLYRRSVRVSMGHVLRVPFGVLPVPLPAALDQIHAAGITTFALTPRGSTRLAQTPVPLRWAVAFGAEGPGLSDAALAGIGRGVRIPMAQGVDSLNVATAVAVTLAYFTG